ncbi:MAG: hypothetical protein QNK37_08735 [Acidobacteriota bacterium]|nr:hypothetical protein [Acidobacteriota bacterium]
MEPLDTALDGPASLDAYFNQSDHFSVYTHSVKSRVMVLGVFVAYLFCFVLFLNWLRNFFGNLFENQRALGMMAQGSELNNFALYALAIAAVLVALAFFFYLFWGVVDVWGLQVCCSKRELRVQNTITGWSFARLTGVGSVLMEDVAEIKGTKLFTYVHAKSGIVRFSPVDHLDRLIETILTNAKDARIVH